MEVERGEVLLLFPDRDRYGGRDLRNGVRREFYDREDKNRYQDYKLKHDRGKIHSRNCSSRTSDSLSGPKNGKVHRDGSSRSPDFIASRRRSDKISSKQSSELLIESKASKAVTNGVGKLEEQKFRVPSTLPEGKRRKVSPIARSSEDKLVDDFVATDLASFGATEEGLVTVHDLQRGSAGNELKDGDLDEECALTRALSASKWADESDFADKEDLSTDRKRSSDKFDNYVYSCSEVEEVLEERYQNQRSGSLAESENAHRTCSFEMTISNGVHGMEIDVEGHAAVVPDRTPEIDYLDSDEDDDISSGSIAGDRKVLRDVNMLQECRSADSFQMLNKINEGTYGIVYKAKDKKTGEVVALKKVKLEREKDGFPQWALREINILLSLHHPSIVGVKEVVVGGKLDSIFMVMEYVEQDLKGFLKANKEKLTLREVKHLMLQLIEGVKYLHDNWVLHRDLKPSNVLINDQLEVKICDFGMARQYGSPLRPYTQLVVTLIYRAPELLLGEKLYSTAVDMWSLGCIMAELLAGEPLFPGESEIDQLGKIFKILGTPNDDTWPGFAALPGSKCKFVEQPYNKLRQKFPKISGTFFSGKPALSDVGYDLLSKFLTYDPEKRITAEDALKHPWFNEFPLPKQSEFLQMSPLTQSSMTHTQYARGAEQHLIKALLWLKTDCVIFATRYMCILHGSGLSNSMR